MIIALGGVEISIHALREEGDGCPSGAGRTLHPFLSTPSARRATASDLGPWPPDPISIHALREEGDLVFDAIQREFQFLSTPSARRATGCAFSGHRSGTISIHALREEGDC